MIQTSVIREEEASIKKVPPQNQAVGKPVGNFLISDRSHLFLFDHNQHSCREKTHLTKRDWKDSGYPLLSPQDNSQ